MIHEDLIDVQEKIEVMSKNGKDAAVMLTAKIVGSEKEVPICRLAKIDNPDNEENVLRKTVLGLRALANELHKSLNWSADNLSRYGSIEYDLQKIA